MKNELIKIENRNGQKVVSARELYKGLEVKTRFSLWIEQYVKENNKYGFENELDFCHVVVTTPQNQHGGIQELQDYSIKLDMAKEISMLTGNDLGKQFRRYFIECEKQLTTIVKSQPTMSRRDELALKILRGRPSIIELKEYDDLVKLEEIDGTNLIITCTQVVEQLKVHIPCLTTKYFNMWLVYKGLGSYDVPFGEKKRIFQPNEVYDEFVSGKGFSFTGKSNIGDKVRVVYTSYMVARIIKQHLGSLIEFVNAQLSLEE